ncbi:MAG: FecR family protein [Candidatus Nanohaloarchaea archaeon]|nr:FecR family protein [Candidatus Nanohaloarchaea archaeon]
MKKTILIVVVVLLIAAPIFIYVHYFTGPNPAVLKDYSGDVEVNGEKPKKGQSLSQGDQVSSEKGEATLVFFGNSILRLDKNTQISIKKLEADTSTVGIKQKKGRTWSRAVRKIKAPYTGVLGGVEEYSVDTPTAVATVRGTSFSAVKDKVSVVKGTVTMVKGDLEEQVSNATAVTEDGMEVKSLERNQWIEENLEKDRKFDREYLKELLDRYPVIVKFVKDRYNATEEEIKSYIRKRGVKEIRDRIDKRLEGESLESLEDKGLNEE